MTTTSQTSAKGPVAVSRKQRFQHPLAIPVITFLLLFFMAIVGFISIGGSTIGASDSRLVRVSIDGEQQVIPTRAETVGDLLERLEVELIEEDIVEPALDTEITDSNFSINVYKARPVTVVDSDRRVTTFTAKPTPREVAEHAGLEVFPEDKVESQPAMVEPETIITEGLVAEKVVIDRATPVTINLYGKAVTIRTHARTVYELLQERGVDFDSESVMPEVSSRLENDMIIFVTHPGKQIVTTEESIPQPRDFVDDPNLQRGQTELRSAGRPGKRVIVYEVMPDGSRRVLQEVVVVYPVPDVFARGTKVILNANITGSKIEWMAAAGISPSDYQYVDYIVSRESGWCPTKWQGHYGACPSYYEELYSPDRKDRGYGLCQSTPAIKMSAAGSDWQTNPVTQLRWCTSYATSRYGSWEQAYLAWSVKHWW